MLDPEESETDPSENLSRPVRGELAAGTKRTLWGLLIGCVVWAGCLAFVGQGVAAPILAAGVLLWILEFGLTRRTRGTRGAFVWVLVTVMPPFSLVFWIWFEIATAFRKPYGLPLKSDPDSLLLIPGWMAAWGTIAVAVFIAAVVWRLNRPGTQTADPRGRLSGKG